MAIPIPLRPAPTLPASASPITPVSVPGGANNIVPFRPPGLRPPASVLSVPSTSTPGVFPQAFSPVTSDRNQPPDTQQWIRTYGIDLLSPEALSTAVDFYFPNFPKKPPALPPNPSSPPKPVPASGKLYNPNQKPYPIVSSTFVYVTAGSRSSDGITISDYPGIPINTGVSGDVPIHTRPIQGSRLSPQTVQYFAIEVYNDYGQTSGGLLPDLVAGGATVFQTGTVANPITLTPTTPAPTAPPPNPTPDTAPPPLPNPVPDGVPTITPFPRHKPATPPAPTPQPPKEPAPTPPPEPPAPPEPPPPDTKPKPPIPPKPEPPPVKLPPTPPPSPSPSPAKPPQADPPSPEFPSVPTPSTPNTAPATAPTIAPVVNPGVIPAPAPIPAAPTPNPNPQPQPATPANPKPQTVPDPAVPTTPDPTTPPLANPKEEPKPSPVLPTPSPATPPSPEVTPAQPQTPATPKPSPKPNPNDNPDYNPDEGIPLELPNNPNSPTTPLPQGNPYPTIPQISPPLPFAPTVAPAPISPAIAPATAAPLVPAGVAAGQPVIPQVVPNIPDGVKQIPSPLNPGGVAVPGKAPIVPVEPAPLDPCKSPNADPCASNISDIVSKASKNTAANSAALAALSALLTPAPTQVKIFVKCQDNAPVFGTKTVFVPVNSLGYVGELFERIANTEGESCNQQDAIASVPEWWQIRPEAHRPQMIYIYRVKNANGTWQSGGYSLTIPHPKQTTAATVVALPAYRKGNYQSILTLSDNSKVIVNGKDTAACEAMIQAAKAQITDSYLVGSSIKSGVRGGATAFVEKAVKLWAIDYYSKGMQGEVKADWRKRIG